MHLARGLKMTAKERLDAVIAGQEADRIPASVWFHFGTEHLPPPAVAQLHAQYQRAYGWDFLKVMADYRLPVPDAAFAGDSLDLDALLAQTDWESPFLAQLACLGHLAADVGGAVPLIDTIYSPWMQLLRHVGRDQRETLLTDPARTGALLDRLTDVTCSHLDRLRAHGVYGIFFATSAACSAEADASALQQARDMRILVHAHGLARILHLHGSGLALDRVAAYPREVLHCDDHDPASPDLEAQRRAGALAIMGGLPSAGLTRLSRVALRRTMANAVALAGPEGLILAPGCSVSPSIAAGSLSTIRNWRP
ncbi:MAG: uroporphyrinogen decarboxylase family protein [Devosia sp.]